MTKLQFFCNFLVALVVILLVDALCLAGAADAADSLPSNIASVTTPNVAPPTPTGLVAVWLSPTSVKLTWTYPTTNNADYFRLERRLPGGTFSTLTTNIAVTATSYTDNAALPATTYEYRLFGVNSP